MLLQLTSALHAGNHQIGGTVSRRHATRSSTLNADAHLSRETKHHTCACETLHVLSSSSSSQLMADCPVSVAIPTTREDSLKMSDVNYRMLVGPAGPGSTMSAELSVTSSDSEGPHPYPEHQVHSTPSQESLCGGHEHSCLVVGMLHWWFHIYTGAFFNGFHSQQCTICYLDGFMNFFCGLHSQQFNMHYTLHAWLWSVWICTCLLLPSLNFIINSSTDLQQSEQMIWTKV